MNAVVSLPDPEFLRVPPHSVSAEQSVIGGLMLAPDRIEAVSERLTESDFYQQRHRAIYRAMLELSARGEPCDAVTLGDWFEDNDLAEVSGGAAYLVELANNTPSAANIAAYADIVREKSVRRQVIDLAGELVEQAFHADGEGAQLLDRGIADLMSLQRIESRNEYTLREAIGQAINAAHAASQLKPGEIPGIRTGIKRLDEVLGGWHNSDLTVIGARPSMGKAQPMDARVLLANGEWKYMAAVRIGDSLASVDGAPSHVTGIFPQGKRKIMRIRFDDGREVRCDTDHLWTVTSSRWRGEKTHTTEQLRTMIAKESFRRRIRVVSHDGEFGRAWHGIDPWLLGFLLGDGACSKSGVHFSTSEDYIIDRVTSACPIGHTVVHTDRCNYRICGVNSRNDVATDLIGLGVHGCRSWEKRVPRDVFVSDRVTRQNVLMGLIESDGWVQSGSLQFSSASEMLANDVCALTRSIGGKASVRRKTNVRYKTRDGLHVDARDAFIVTVVMPDANVICSPRIQSKLTARRKTTSPIIVDIVDDGIEEAQCIMVDHPAHLYITDDYTTTHNTALLLNMVLAAGVPCGLVSAEQPSEQVGARVMSIESKVAAVKMRNGHFDEADLPKLDDAARRLIERMCMIFDRSGPSIAEVSRMARKWKQQNGIRVLFVDYVQRIEASNADKRTPKHERVGEVVRGLKNLARDLGIPVVALAQVGRQVEARTDHRPHMGDLSDSSEIEKEADQILTLYRAEVYDPESPDAGTAEIAVEKNRHGPTGLVKCAWLAETMRFADLEARYGY